MKVILRRDWKRWLKDDSFYEYFPEYTHLRGLIKVGCCGMKDSVYKSLTQLILDNTPKWFNYLGVSTIQVFVDKKATLLSDTSNK